MRSRRLFVWLVLIVVLVAGVYVARPYGRALSLIVRATNMGGRVEAFANRQSRAVTVRPPATIPSRYGNLPAQVYDPEGTATRTVLLVPGIHAAGINEPRLTGLAKDLAGSGVRVMTMALPDLEQYRITPRSTDMIEDAVAWISRRGELASDGRVGIIGISFAGGLAIVAAGRPSIRGRAAFVLSFGGHGDLPRVMKYLCTGEAPHVDGLEPHAPHDYGVAVILYGLADRVVPADQVQRLREAVGTFLHASQLTLVDMKQADATFAAARALEKMLPEPSATYLKYVNDRNVKALGPVLLPYVSNLGGDPSLSPDRAASAPAAPVYLLHGADDSVIPAPESVLLARHLERQGTPVRVLLSRLITHAEVDKSAAATETWKLVSFWADVLQR